MQKIFSEIMKQLPLALAIGAGIYLGGVFQKRLPA